MRIRPFLRPQGVGIRKSLELRDTDIDGLRQEAYFLRCWRRSCTRTIRVLTDPRRHPRFLPDFTKAISDRAIYGRHLRQVLREMNRRKMKGKT